VGMLVDRDRIVAAIFRSRRQTRLPRDKQASPARTGPGGCGASRSEPGRPQRVQEWEELR